MTICYKEGRLRRFLANSTMASAEEQVPLDLAPILHSTLLFIFCHAIHTCVFFVALYYIVTSGGLNRKRFIFAGVITYFWCAITVMVGLEWKNLDIIFIVHGASPKSTESDVVGILTINVLSGLNVLLADVLLAWRCSIFYGRNWKILSVIGLCLLMEIALSSVMLIYNVTYSSSGRVWIWNLLYYTMPVITNTLCTSLILLRIVRVNGVRASLRTYGSIIEILVESAVIYSSVFTIVAILRVADVGHAFYYPLTMSYSLTGIAPTLIIARVMAGHSRPDDSWTRGSLPHLDGNTRTMGESMRFATVHRSTAFTVTSFDLEEAREGEMNERLHTPNFEKSIPQNAPRAAITRKTSSISSGAQPTTNIGNNSNAE
ncbi:hypothetical protein BDZ89DRAFT_322925 [Hymenopellis radicata]|nr:hypothetical protein BDZ89DRAFT_322925 [Hymenopellis radicata]